MVSKLFLIYFYSTFRKNFHSATLNNKLNKTKLKLKKKVNPKFKPLGLFFFFSPRFFFFFPTVTVHHLHLLKYSHSLPANTSTSCLHCPFRVFFFFFFYDVHRTNTSFANNGLQNGNQSIISHAFAHSTSIRPNEIENQSRSSSKSNGNQCRGDC